MGCSQSQRNPSAAEANEDRVLPFDLSPPGSPVPVTKKNINPVSEEKQLINSFMTSPKGKNTTSHEKGNEVVEFNDDVSPPSTPTVRREKVRDYFKMSTSL